MFSNFYGIRRKDNKQWITDNLGKLLHYPEKSIAKEHLKSLIVPRRRRLKFPKASDFYEIKRF